ncbi:MAG: hypothetical protein V7635_2755 [Arthrobacter sp.]
MDQRWIFNGRIAGIGTGSGLRAVVGLWQQSPFGPCTDAMVQLPSGHRILLAPTAEVGAFISAVYNFDESRVVHLASSHEADQLTVDAGPLQIRARLGARTGLGAAARLIPRRVAVHPRWLRAVSPLAARILPGVRTAGTAKGGRQEYYGVTDLRRIDSASVSWDGHDVGPLCAIRPAVGFGFSSVPPEPSLARVQTTIEGSAGSAR